jgi:hypothetical protein
LEDFSYDTVMVVVPAIPLNHWIWTVTLEDEDWQYPFLCLATLIEEEGWVRIGRIDIIKRLFLGWRQNCRFASSARTRF